MERGRLPLPVVFYDDDNDGGDEEEPRIPIGGHGHCSPAEIAGALLSAAISHRRCRSNERELVVTMVCV